MHFIILRNESSAFGCGSVGEISDGKQMILHLIE